METGQNVGQNDLHFYCVIHITQTYLNGQWKAKSSTNSLARWWVRDKTSWWRPLAQNRTWDWGRIATESVSSQTPSIACAVDGSLHNRTRGVQWMEWTLHCIALHWIVTRWRSIIKAEGTNLCGRWTFWTNFMGRYFIGSLKKRELIAWYHSVCM